MKLRTASLLILLYLVIGTIAFGQDVPQAQNVPPRAYFGIVVDCSGMQRLQIDRIVSVIKQLSETIGEDDRVFIVRFVDAARIRVVQDFTNNRADIDDAAEALYVEGGQTAIIDALDVAGRYLGREVQDLSPQGVRSLLVISSGDDRGSGKKVDEVIGRLKQGQIRVFAIGLSDLEVSKRLFDKFARETGGKTFSPRTSSELSNAVLEIARLLRGSEAGNK